MEEVFAAVGPISNEEFGRRLGKISRGPVSSWRRGEALLEEWGQKLIAHEFDVPLSWWNEPNVPVRDVIGKGLGKDENITTNDNSLPVTVHQEVVPTQQEVPDAPQSPPLAVTILKAFQETQHTFYQGLVQQLRQGIRRDLREELHKVLEERDEKEEEKG